MLGRPWTREFELQYWHEENRETYLEKVADKLIRFEFFRYVPDVAECAVSVGGGRYGDVFNFYGRGLTSRINHRIVVDPLMRELGTQDLPRGVEGKVGYANEIPINSGVADVVVCMETLDHCNSVDEFLTSVADLKRILAPGGVLFFQIPLRVGVKDFHPITMEEFSAQDIAEMFCDMDIKRFHTYQEPDAKTIHVYLVVKNG